MLKTFKCFGDFGIVWELLGLYRVAFGLCCAALWCECVDSCGVCRVCFWCALGVFGSVWVCFGIVEVL